MKVKIRDKETFFLFIVGFSLSFFIMINGYQLLNAWYAQRAKAVNEEKYGNDVTFEMVSFEVGEDGLVASFHSEEERVAYEQKALQTAYDFLTILAQQKETTYIQDLWLPIGEAAEYQSTNIVLAYGEEWYRTLQEGRYPNEQELENGIKAAIIGESAKQYVETIDGYDVIKINGENYQVLGIFENYQASEYDMDITLFYTLPQKVEKDIVLYQIADYIGYADPFMVTVGKNSDSVESVAASLEECIENTYGWQVEVLDSVYDSESDINKIYSSIKGVIITILFAFSILNCQQITKLWILRKKKDLIILKTYGFNNGHIVLRLIQELIGLILISFLAIIVLNSGYWLVTKAYSNFAISNVKSAGFLFVMFVAVVILSIVPVIKSIKNLVPADGLREL